MLNIKVHLEQFQNSKMSNATQMGTALAPDYNVHTGKEANQGKGKAHPITCHEGTEGKYTCSSTLSLTSKLDGDGWLRSRTAPLSPGMTHTHCIGG